ncbi:MAG: type II toxin-antitoxin system RelE/ParE family toxin [Byssovorax sp.]
MANRPIPILFSARAKREIDAAHTWWAEHSEARALADAVAAALRFIEAFPEASPRVQIRGKWSTTRRASVAPLGYHLFYRYDERAGTILVRAFWHERRRPPRL